MRPKRCAILTHSYFPQDPRPRRQAAALLKKGWRVECICLRRADQDEQEVVEGVEVLRLPVQHIRKNLRRYLVEYGSFFLHAFALFARRSGPEKYDVVQVNTLPDFLVFAALVPRLRGARIVLDMRQPSPEFFAAQFGKSLRSLSTRLVMLVESLSARFAHHLLVSGEAARNTYRKRGIPDSKMTVILNSCDKTRFRPSTNGTRPAGNGPIRLVYHGTIIERYGIDTAVRAVASLRESIKEVTLDIYGEGEYTDSIRQLIRSLGLENCVHLHGYIDPSAVPEKIEDADIGLIPYKRDIFIDMMLPNKLFEYVAMKKPFVVSPIRAILDHYPPSLLHTFEKENPYDLAREIVHILENGEDARRRAEKLYAHFEKECWERVSRSYINAIDGHAN